MDIQSLLAKAGGASAIGQQLGVDEATIEAFNPAFSP